MRREKRVPVNSKKDGCSAGGRDREAGGCIL